MFFSFFPKNLFLTGEPYLSNLGPQQTSKQNVKSPDSCVQTLQKPVRKTTILQKHIVANKTVSFWSLVLFIFLVCSSWGMMMHVSEFIYQWINLTMRLSIRLSICASLHLSTYPLVCLSICISIYLSNLSVCPSICIFTDKFQSMCFRHVEGPSAFLSVYLSACLHLCINYFAACFAHIWVCLFSRVPPVGLFQLEGERKPIILFVPRLTNKRISIYLVYGT